MIDPVSDLVEETSEDDRETRIVVLFDSAGPVLLEELDEKDSELAAVGPLQSPAQRWRSGSTSKPMTGHEARVKGEVWTKR